MAEQKNETNGIVADVGSHVKDYYGKVLADTKDISSTACTFDIKSVPKHVREILQVIHEDVTSKFYGCGVVAPERLTGLNILDLGCGSGRDVFILSKMVGESGHVTGVDFTEELVETASKYIDHHAKIFGFAKPNTKFMVGNIEKLKESGLEDNTFDVLTSNGVINLVNDKRAVLREAHKVLKEGGELFFFDVYVDRELPPKVRKDQELWGECIAGALHWTNFAEIAKEVGFSTPRLVNSKRMEIADRFRERVGEAQFVTATYRLFKLPSTKSPAACLRYKGTIPGYPAEVAFDHYTVFHKGVGVRVNEETATIIQNSRFKNDFDCCEKDDAMNAINPILLAHSTPPSCGAK